MSSRVNALAVEGEDELRRSMASAHGILATLASMTAPWIDGSTGEGGLDAAKVGEAGPGELTPVEQLRRLQRQYLASERALRGVIGDCEEAASSAREDPAEEPEDAEEVDKLRARLAELQDEARAKNAAVKEGMDQLEGLLGTLQTWQGAPKARRRPLGQ